MAGARAGRICLGAVAGAHGVRGVVRLKSFTSEPGDIAAYGPVSDEEGDRVFEIEVIGEARGVLLARISGVEDRDAAESLKGVRLYVARDALPPPGEEEYYHDDLLGLAAEGIDGARLGTVVGVQMVGETDVLEIDRGGGRPTALVPFTRAVVPMVDIAASRLVVDAPAGLIEDDDEATEGEA